MKHTHIDELRRLAEVGDMPVRAALTRRERLERWAEILERDPDRRLRTLEEIEFVAPAERPQLRADNSPLTIAFQDPVLRDDGLAGDRLGDGMAFFGLSEGQAHRLLCSCLNGRAVQSGVAARRLRGIVARSRLAVPAALAVTALAAIATPVVLWLG